MTAKTMAALRALYVLFADISYYQPLYDSRYKLHGIAIRADDASFRDPNFLTNYARIKHALDTGVLQFAIVYFVWEPGQNWTTFNTLTSMLGTPHPKVAYMADVESWGGRVRGNFSREINQLCAMVEQWVGKHLTAADRLLGKHRARVLGYGNGGDLASIWPDRPKYRKIVLANYSGNFGPAHWAHQFSDHYPVAPFGHADMNSVDGKTVADVVHDLGLDVTKQVIPRKPPVPTKPPVVHPPTPVKPLPVVVKHPSPVKLVYVTVKSGDTMVGIGQRFGLSLRQIEGLNPHVTNPNWIKVGQKLCVGAAKTAVMPSKTNKAQYVVVKSGDTVGQLAAHYKSSVKQITAWNRLLDPNRIIVGDRLRVK